jgi:hypothetical protein
MKNPVEEPGMSTRIVVLIAVLATGAGAAHAADPVVFAIDLEKGTTFTTAQTFQWTIEMPMQGAMSLKGELEYKYEVLDVTAEKIFKLKATCQKVKVNFDMAGMKVDYDSTKKEDKDKVKNPLVASYALVDLSYTFSINQRGETVGKVEGLDEIKKKVLSRLEEGDMQTMRARMGIEKRFEEKAFKKEIEAIFKVPSADPRSPGDTWENPTSAFSLPLMGAMSMKDRKVTLTKVEEDMAHMTQKAKLVFPKGGGAGGLGAMVSMLKMVKNTFNATTLFHCKNHIPFKNEVKIELNLEPREGAMEGMGNFKMVIKGILTWEVKKFERSM